MTRAELINALKLVDQRSRGENGARFEAMRGAMSLPELVKTMAIDIFGRRLEAQADGDAELGTAISLVRKALNQLWDDGYFTFDDD